MSEFAVRTIPIADLRDHPRNSNRHGEHQLAVLEARFRALGWYKNVVVAEWEGTTTLLAGHGVTRGAERAGETVAPCHVREIDPLSAEALDILEGDNTVADLAEPDLRERLRNLVELDAAGRLGNVGFDDGALDRLKAELQAEDFAATQGPPVEDPGPSEPPVEPVSKLGDVWLCGEHRVVCGDCTEAGVWRALMQGTKANVIFTSPPYAEQRKEQYGGMPASEYVEWFRTIADRASENLAIDGSFFVNLKAHCEDGERETYDKRLVIAMREWGWKFIDECVWLKDGVPGDSTPRLKNVWEPVFHFCLGVPWSDIKAVGHRTQRLAEYASTNLSVGTSGNVGLQNAVMSDGISAGRNVVYVSNRNVPNGVEHPAAFPPPLPAFFIEAYSLLDGYVADPFLGSGTTLIAAEKLGRVCYGIEIEPRYVDVAVRRWQQATGQTAILESTGEPFPVVE